MSSKRTWSARERATAGRLATIIARDFYHGRLDLTARGMAAASWSDIPEVKYAERLGESGTPRPDVRLFLTFIMALDRARDSEQLWRAGFQLFRSHPELFQPVRVCGFPVDELRDLLKASKVSQRHRPDTNAWCRIALTLVRETDCPVHRVIVDGVGDAEELLLDLRRSNRQGHARFPFLKGAKIAPVWIRIMADPGRSKIARLDSIPVGVDVQVRRVTENLGITSTQDIPLASAKCTIQTAWKDAVDAGDIAGPPGIRGTCAALDPVLWFFGKYGCSHCERVGRREPISRGCSSCVWEPRK